MNKRTVSPSKFPEVLPNGFRWTHDTTGEKYPYWCKLVGNYPEHAMCWCEGIFGGSTFECSFGEFIAENAVRGFDYEAIIAFDSEGNGILFSK